MEGLWINPKCVRESAPSIAPACYLQEVNTPFGHTLHHTLPPVLILGARTVSSRVVCTLRTRKFLRRRSAAFLSFRTCCSSCICCVRLHSATQNLVLAPRGSALCLSYGHSALQSKVVPLLPVPLTQSRGGIRLFPHIYALLCTWPRESRVVSFMHSCAKKVQSGRTSCFSDQSFPLGGPSSTSTLLFRRRLCDRWRILTRHLELMKITLFTVI